MRAVAIPALQNRERKRFQGGQRSRCARQIEDVSFALTDLAIGASEGAFGEMLVAKKHESP